jgi:hypothetical protein
MTFELKSSSIWMSSPASSISLSALLSQPILTSPNSWDGDTPIDDFYLDAQGGDVYAASWDSSDTDAGVYDVNFEAWDLAGNSRLLEDAETVCLEELIPGDLNGDGCVDQSDLGILLADWGCTGGGCSGDCDGDGDTDQSDLGILLSHWGEGCP